MQSFRIKELNIRLTASPFFKWSLLAMLVSYFYNLSIIGYSLKGENELRIYDLVGVYIIYVFFINKSTLTEFIIEIPFFKYLYYFLQWSTFTLFFTLLFSLFGNRFLWFIQSFLYLFHFWVFFLTAVFLSVFIQDLNRLKSIVQFLLIMSNISFFIIILQNLGVIPFLWNDTYNHAYGGFLSGTLGPNKIVVGISSLLIFILSIGLINEKRIKLSKVLIIISISIALIALMMSGSRTSYLGLLSFSFFYLIRNTYKFLASLILIIVLFFSISYLKPQIFEKIKETFENRVEKKIKKAICNQGG